MKIYLTIIISFFGISQESNVYGPDQCMTKNCKNQMDKCWYQTNPQCFEKLRRCQSTYKDDVNAFIQCVENTGDPNAIAVVKCAQKNGCFDDQQQQIRKQQ